MKTYWGVFLSAALAGDEWSASRPGRFTPEERAYGTHWIGGWVGPRASLDDVKKRKFLTLPGLELRPLDRPPRSQSLHLLHYTGSLTKAITGAKLAKCITAKIKACGHPTCTFYTNYRSQVTVN
jgi:hypothetical protein